MAILGKDYPALVKQEAGQTDGLLFVPETRSQRIKLDDFEGEAYAVTSVEVTIEGGVVEADAYVWNGDTGELSTEPWDLEVFIANRLEDWLDCFCGMEMVGVKDCS